MISKCAKFYCHSEYSSEVASEGFLSFLLEIKYATTDTPDKIGLRFSPKNQLPQAGRKRIFCIIEQTDTCEKARVAVLLRSIHTMIVLLGYI